MIVCHSRGWRGSRITFWEGASGIPGGSLGSQQPVWITLFARLTAIQLVSLLSDLTRLFCWASKPTVNKKKSDAANAAAPPMPNWDTVLNPYAFTSGDFWHGGFGRHSGTVLLILTLLQTVGNSDHLESPRNKVEMACWATEGRMAIPRPGSRSIQPGKPAPFL